MSFFGGGTDMKEFFYENGGSVLSTTFDKYCYVNMRYLSGFFDYSTEVVYSKIERVNSIDRIQHPAIRNALKMQSLKNVRVTYEADLPARSGLGTSSSFAVGILNASHALKGEYVDKKRLADEAIYLERCLCNEEGGWQDQIAVAYGGMNRIDFFENEFKVHPVLVTPSRKRMLNDNLLMFFTGFTRFSAEVQKSNILSSPADKKNILEEMYGLVNEAEKILVNQDTDLNEFGRLLDYTWELKKRTGKSVSTDSIDKIYKKAMAAGASGGKLLGAGGGGFLVFYVRPEYQEAVKRAMKDFLFIPFQFENDGTQIIYYTVETDQ